MLNPTIFYKRNEKGKVLTQEIELYFNILKKKNSNRNYTLKYRQFFSERKHVFLSVEYFWIYRNSS